MSLKKDPREKIKSTTISISDAEKDEIREYTDAAGLSFAEYVRMLTDADKVFRRQEVARLKAEAEKLAANGHPSPVFIRRKRH